MRSPLGAPCRGPPTQGAIENDDFAACMADTFGSGDMDTTQTVPAEGATTWLQPDWPLAPRVQAGIERLTPEARRRVGTRVADAVARFTDAEAARATPAVRRLFSFLAQIEVIGIEVPLSRLGGDEALDARTEAMLVAQLEDEVVHTLVFGALARRLGRLDPPIRSAESLLASIRAEADGRVAALLLNLVGEGWIENLLEGLATWGLADEVFKVVLADEERHHHEAWDHVAGLPRDAVGPAVRRFEEGLLEMAQDPRLALPLLAAGGETRFRDLMDGFLARHLDLLAELGLEPDPRIAELSEAIGALDADGVLDDIGRPTEVAPETQWRRTALTMWETPRSPVMQGWTDIVVGRTPRRYMTPIAIAALGSVWKEYPRVNRYAFGGRAWQAEHAHVAVRVMVGDSLEAVSTVVVTHADRRSVSDIVRILRAGVARLEKLGEEAVVVAPEAPDEDLGAFLDDEELMRMVPPEAVVAPVSFTNVGRAGLHAGFGAMPGHMGTSVEVIMGRIERRPVWTGWRYAPKDVVTLGFSADHRVMDGHHVGHGMKILGSNLSKKGVKEILARPDTLPSPEGDVVSGEPSSDAPALAAAGLLGAEAERMRIAFAAKCPWWLPWKCKK